MVLREKIRLFNLFYFFAHFNFFIPIKIVYFSYLLHDFALAASLISISLVSSALFEVPTGIFSDLIGRRKTIILGMINMLLAYLFFAIGINYWVLVVGAIFEGLGKSFFSGNNNAYLHDLLSAENLENEYHHYYGKINAFQLTASSLAALLSGLIMSYSFSLMAWLNIVPQLLAFFICLMMPEIKTIKKESSNIYLHLKEALGLFKSNLNIRLLSLSNILGSGPGLAASEFHSAVIASVWPLWAIGIARALQEIIIVPGFYFAGKVIKRLGAMKIIFFGSIYSWLGNIFASVFPSVVSPLWIASGTILYGPSETASESLLQKEFTEKQRATIASLNSLARSIYFGIVIYLVGVFANHNGPFKALLLTQIIYIPSLFVTWLLFKRIK